MTRLSDQLHSAAAADDVELDLDALHHRAATRARRRTRTRAGAGLAGAVLVVALVAGVATTTSGADDTTTAAAGDPTATEPTAGSETTTSDDAATTSVPASTEATTTTDTTTPASDSTVAEVPTTTAPPPPTSTPAPAGPTADEERFLDLTYTADEQYRLGRPECPDITHWMDGEADTGAGQTYVLREDYCGTHEGDTWVGEGTFSLVGPGGSLRGRTESRAPAGTDGVPYTFHVDQGDGDFAGWTGSCGVTVSITDKAFGSQHHEGTIRCRLAPVADAPAGGDPTSPPTTTTPIDL